MNLGIFTVFGVAVFFAILFGSLTFETVMAKPNSSSSADSGVCHFDNTDTQMWEALWVHSNGQIKAHVNVHGDETFTTDVEAVWCVTNQDGTVVKPPPVCGDGVIEGTETCDDGILNGTPEQCNLTCNGQVPPDCGNGVIDEGEQCDGSDLGGATCESIPGDDFNLEVNLLGNRQGNVKGEIDGGSSGNLKCDASCMFDFSECNTRLP